MFFNTIGVHSLKMTRWSKHFVVLYVNIKLYITITAFFWATTHLLVVILYRHFGTNYWSHLQGSRVCPAASV